MCNLLVNRMNDDICQIKLVLDVFEIAGPDPKGVCADEFFRVTGGSTVAPGIKFVVWSTQKPRRCSEY